MKCYVRYEDIKTPIKKRFGNQLRFVEEKQDAEIIISGVFKAEDYHPDLKAVIVPYTSHQNIDIETLEAHRVNLFVTTVHSTYVAEKAVQLMFALLGHVIPYHKNMEKGDWSSRMTEDRVEWATIQNKRVGFYGYGRIGRLIHQFLTPYHIHAITIDRKKAYPETMTLVKDLNQLIDQSDVLFVATPLTEETEGAIQAHHLNRMHDKVIVNVGRGAVIDEKALYEALKNNTLKGLASDVWYVYPKDDNPTHPSRYPMHQFKHVVMSPHCAAATPDAGTAMIEKVLDHLQAILNGNHQEALDLKRLT